jgi:hypothetical protein
MLDAKSARERAKWSRSKIAKLLLEVQAETLEEAWKMWHVEVRLAAENTRAEIAKLEVRDAR